MIENLSLKQLIVLTVIFIITCLLIITLESYFIETNSNHTMAALARERGCWDSEAFVIKQPCSACSDFDKRSQHIAACATAPHKELVSCASSGDVYRSCSLQDSTHEFYRFELLVWLTGTASSAFLTYRRRHLDRRMLQKIQAQVAAGV